MSNTQPQRVVITAGASGIGLAIAERYLANGARVMVCDVQQDAIDQACITYPVLTGCVADVGIPAQVEQFIDKAQAELGGIDVLVNNAGIGGPKATVEDIDYQAWDDCLRINLSGMFYCAKGVVPGMKAQGHGSIINISTASTKTGLPHRLPYVASKAGVLGLTHNLARELGPFNIRCNVILPGKIDNPRGDALTQRYADEHNMSFTDAEDLRLQYISMRSKVKPSEIGDMAVFLASDRAKHITAQEIAVDGNSEWEI